MAVLHSNLTTLPIHPQGEVPGVTLGAVVREFLGFVVVMVSTVVLVSVMYKLGI